MIAICRECKQTFPTLEIPLIGESVNQKFIRWVEALGQHVRDKHRKMFEQDISCATMLHANLVGLSLTWHFDCADPEFLKQRDMMRAEFMSMIGRTIPDDAILRSVQKSDWANPQHTALKLLTEMRDRLTFADVKAAPADPPALSPAVDPGSMN